MLRRATAFTSCSSGSTCPIHRHRQLCVDLVNNNAYVNAKVLNVYWGGVRYTPIPHLDLTAAYYGFSFDADYAFTNRFDAYRSVMYSGVHNGLANGYDFTATNLNPTIGVRFKF